MSRFHDCICIIFPFLVAICYRAQKFETVHPFDWYTINNNESNWGFPHVLSPKALTDKLDTWTENNSQLNECLDKKYVYFAALDARLSSVEADLWTTRTIFNNNKSIILRNPRSEKGEDTTGKLLSIVNETVGVTPPIVSADEVTSHRLGRRMPGADAQTRPRPVIVKFARTMCATWSSVRDAACVKAAMDRRCTSTKTWHVGGRRWPRRRDNWKNQEKSTTVGPSTEKLL